jgi:hypothetical protein
MAEVHHPLFRRHAPRSSLHYPATAFATLGEIAQLSAPVAAANDAHDDTSIAKAAALRDLHPTEHNLDLEFNSLDPQREALPTDRQIPYGGGRSQSMKSTLSVTYRRGPTKTTTRWPSVT